MSRIRVIAIVIVAIAAGSALHAAAKPTTSKSGAETLYGAPDFARALSGSELGWQGPWGTSYASNLTPDPETGLGYYSAKEIVAAIKSGKRLDGTPMAPPMPWPNIATYNDDDLFAIAAYLLSLPIVSHQVPVKLPPGQQASGPVIVLPAPPEWDAPRPAPGAEQKN